jgi:ribosomal protein L37E
MTDGDKRPRSRFDASPLASERVRYPTVTKARRDHLGSGSGTAHSIAHSPARVCRRCGSSYLVRSHVRWYEILLKALVSKRPFRCEKCSHRAWHDVAPSSDATDRVPVDSGKWPNGTVRP